MLESKVFSSIFFSILRRFLGDLESSREISSEEGKKLADRYRCSYIECSAKTGSGVSEIFQYMAKDLKSHGDPKTAGI